MSDLDPRVPLLQFPFGGGIDEASRDELVESGNGWAVLENGRQDHRGGYSTRSGFTALATTRLDATSATAAYKLLSDGETIVRISETMKAEAYSIKAASWVPVGRVPEVDYRTIGLPSVNITSCPEDVEYCNGYMAVVVNAAAALEPRVMVLDATSFGVVLPPSTAGVTKALVGSFSGRYLVHLRATGATLTIYILDTNTPATVSAGWTSLATVGIDFVTSGDFAIQSLSDRVAVAYATSGAGTDLVTLKTYNQTGLLESATINTGSVSPDCVDVRAYPGGTLWVAWNELLDVKMCGFTADDLVTVVAGTATIITTNDTAPTLISISPSSTTAGRLLVNELQGIEAEPGQLHMRGYQTTAFTAATLGSQIKVQNAQHCSRAVYYGGRHYVLVFGGTGTDGGIAAGNTQKNLILVDFTEDYTFLRPVVNLTPGLAVNAYYGKSKIVAGADATVLYGVAGVTKSGVADAATLIEYDFASLRRWQVAAHGNTTVLSGGVLSSFDGVRTAEVGFLVRPIKPTGASSATGITGNFRCVCVYEEVDADGNWHVSGLSDPSEVVTVTDKTITWATKPLTITSRMSPLGASYTSTRVAFYRTLTGSVAPYCRVGTALNDTSQSLVTYADTMTDAVLATKLKLYAQPSVPGTSQDRRPPPGLGLLTSYSGMLVGACGSDVWFSGQCVSGEAAWFSPIFQVPIPGEGDITALAAMDGTLFVFKRREIYALSGEPPTDNGAGGGLGFPRRLSADVGAISPFTCTTALAVFFRSDRGIEVMSRSQSVDWVGEGIQDTLAAFPVVTSMTVDQRSCTVLIELAASESSGLVAGTGRTLIYDLSLRSWQSTDRRTSSTGAADAPAQSGCMVYTGSAWRYAWVGANGIVYTENDTHLDSGYWIAKRAVSAWMKAAGLQGFQHVNKALLLGKKHTSHDVSMSYAYDYSASYKTARLYTATVIDALTAAIPNLQLEHGLHDDARCEALRVQILDATPSTGESVGTGQAGTWIALAFEVVPQQGAYPLPDEAK